jgi:hypothetical protein
MQIRLKDKQACLLSSKQRKINITFATWNIRSLYRPDELEAVSRELANHESDLVGVQEL